MIISVKNKFLFFHIPKAGGKHVNDYFIKKYKKNKSGMAMPNILYWEKDPNTDFDLAHIYQDIAPFYISQHMIDKYYSFTIVRNPYNRCYSAYRDILVVKGNNKGKQNYGVWVSQYKKPKDFSEFCTMIEKVANDEPKWYNIHITPQYKFVYHKTKKVVKFVGKFETMDKDFHKIFKDVGMKVNDIWLKNKKTLDVDIDKVRESYLEHFTPEDIHNVNKTYLKDFILFNYPMEYPSTIPFTGKQLEFNMKLIKNIDEMLKPHLNSGLTPKVLQESQKYVKLGFRLVIKDNKIQHMRNGKLNNSHNFGQWESRNVNTLKMIEEVLKHYKIPDLEVLVSTDDILKDEKGGKYPILVMAKRKKDKNILYPDHTFQDWSNAKTNTWDKAKNKIMTSCKKHPFSKKTGKLMFRGNNTHYIRKFLANKSANKNEMNIQMVDLKKNKNKFVTLEDHCKWKYLLNIPGRSYAGRLKYLLVSNSVVFNIKKKEDYQWDEFYYHVLADNKNYVAIQDNNNYDYEGKIKKEGNKYNNTANDAILKQCVDKVKELNASNKDATKIVNENEDLREYFNYESVLFYWYVLLYKLSLLKK